MPSSPSLARRSALVLLALSASAPLAAACGGGSATDLIPGSDASADGRAPSGGDEDGGGNPGTGPGGNDGGTDPNPAPGDAGGGGECTRDDQCRAYSNHCDGCRCQPLPKGTTDPVCPGTPVSCIVDPCQNKTAGCSGGKCVIR